MFEVSDGNIFDPELNLDMILNPVNCKGVSGAGLAKEFKHRFPRSQANYEAMCKRTLMLPDATGRKRKTKAFNPGDILHYVDMDVTRIREYGKDEEVSDEEMQEFINKSVQDVIYFPTKNHWKRPSRIEYIETGLNSLRQLLEKEEMHEKVKRVGIPALGAGLGGLSPVDVSKVIREKLADLEYTFVLFSPLE